MKSSTNSPSKVVNKPLSKTSSDKELQASKKVMPISLSKIKLEVKEIVDENEE